MPKDSRGARRMRSTRCIRRRTDRLPHYLHRLRLAIPATAQLVGHRLAHRRPGAVTRQRADVHEELGTPMPWRDEAEAALVVPGSKGSSQPHGNLVGQVAPSAAMTARMDSGIGWQAQASACARCQATRCSSVAFEGMGCASCHGRFTPRFGRTNSCVSTCVQMPMHHHGVCRVVGPQRAEAAADEAVAVGQNDRRTRHLDSHGAAVASTCEHGHPSARGLEVFVWNRQ